MTHYSEYKVPDAVLEVAVNAYQKAGEGNVTYTGMRAALEAAYKLLDALNRNKHPETNDVEFQMKRLRKNFDRLGLDKEPLNKLERVAEYISTQNTGEKK